MNIYGPTQDQWEEAVRNCESVVSNMEAAIPELPFGIESGINELIEDMEREAKGNLQATALAFPLYRQLMRLGALVAIEAMANEAEKGGSK